MKIITLTFAINENDCIKRIVFDENETDMPSDTETLERIALTIIKIIRKDDGALKVQDMLNELGIDRYNG